jgi:hypothetical protein
VVEGNFTGLCRVEQAAPGSLEPVVTAENGDGAKGSRRVGAQVAPEGSQAKATSFDLLEHANAGQGPQEPLQGKRVGSRDRGQLAAALGAVREHIRQTEFRGYVHQLSDLEPRQHLAQSRRR